MVGTCFEIVHCNLIIIIIIHTSAIHIITQVDNNVVSWQKWNFHVGFNFKEGLVLNNISYNDGGRVRPIVHRMSVAEIIVPYSDPRMPYARKCAFDAVDYGLGQCASSLDLGCDCLGFIHYFDGVFCNKVCCCLLWLFVVDGGGCCCFVKGHTYSF